MKALRDERSARRPVGRWSHDRKHVWFVPIDVGHGFPGRAAAAKTEGPLLEPSIVSTVGYGR